MLFTATRSRLAFGLGFAGFVLIGTLVLLLWLRHRQEDEARHLFEKVAQQSAELVRQMNLPRSEKLAHDLERLTEMSIQFRPAGSDLPVRSTTPDSITILLDGAHEMVFTRSHPAATLTLADPATRNALLAFWFASGAVGWLFARERGKRAESERLAMLGRVATSLAHDIKNPLASIQLHSQLLQPSGEEDAKAVQLIESESRVIEGLVNQWLHLANPLPPVLTRLDLTACVHGVVQNISPQATHASVQITNSLAAPYWVQGDSSRLAQAFRNILLNAIQAMPRGGTLRIEREGPAMIFTDSGPGFSEAALARGTELFFSEKEGGMGVGLNIVSTIIQAHGGQLTIQNTSPHGAAVRVTLPQAV
ncbi:MAG: HAMP domain-containing histidine kinase [Verrucomicrobiaceae bacterium]|nr:HAMP domain-containing histidine kinase [Verrucomicrobiaceae bacterium]